VVKERRPLVSGKGLAEYTGGAISEGLAAKMRVYGTGPRFIKSGGKVLYDLDDIDAWLDSLKRRSTSEASAA
jgi:hypothetical protein